MYNLPKHYTAPINETQRSQLKQRRELALSKSFGPTCNKIPFTSSNLYPGSTTKASHETEGMSSSPNPLRPLDNKLLQALNAMPETGGGFKVYLDEELQGGAAHWSQVWTADVERDGQGAGRVVVKFYVESLFPYPQDTPDGPIGYWWWPAKDLEEREGAAYAMLRSEQGRMIPHCYGLYRFEMPWGEEVTGMLLEDLSDYKISQTFSSVIETHTELHGPPNAASLDEWLSKIFLALHRLQDLGAVDFGFGGNDILVLHSTTPQGDYPIVLLDFANCVSKEQHVRDLKIPRDDPLWQKDPELCEKMERSWRKIDEHKLSVNLSKILGGAIWNWKTMERRRGNIGLAED